MTRGVHTLCAGPAPYFKFDSAKTGNRDQPDDASAGELHAGGAAP